MPPADSTKGKQPAKAHEQPSTFVYDVQQLDAGRCRAPIRILQKLHDLLLDPEQTTALAKWAKHVRVSAFHASAQMLQC